MNVEASGVQPPEEPFSQMLCWPRTMGPSVGCRGPSGSSHTEERVVSGKRADVLLGWAFMVGWGVGGGLDLCTQGEAS